MVNVNKGSPLVAFALGAAAAVALASQGCASAARYEAAVAKLAAPEPLAADHFDRDRHGGLSEEGLNAILAAPILLDQTQRVGVVPVARAYAPDSALPLPGVPAELVRSLEGAGLFPAVSEVSTDWPIDSGIAGLRELAGRYRSGYLLLYRQRFVDDARPNGWAWLYPTVVGAIFAPSRTLETAGVLEATLFDVRTGTLLFTVYERVRSSSEETPWDQDRKLGDLKRRLLETAAVKLADQVVAKARRLAAGPPGRSVQSQAEGSSLSASGSRLAACGSSQSSEVPAALAACGNLQLSPAGVVLAASR